MNKPNNLVHVKKPLHHLAKMKKRNHNTEDVHTERWMVSYADFITLLLAFFVVMYSISITNVEGKYKSFSDSISFAMHLPSFPNSPVMAGGEPSIPTIRPLQPSNYRNKVIADKQTAELGEEQRKINIRMEKVADNLLRVLDSVIQQENVRIDKTKRGIVIDISASTLFAIGEASLQPKSFEVLRSVAEVLSKEDLPIEVEGHTDDIPISTVKFASNWELSAVRASSVARFLIANGVSEQRLSVIGLAANLPLLPNTSVANRARNRRVTITIASPNLNRE